MELRLHDVVPLFFHLISEELKMAIRERQRQRSGEEGEKESFVLLMYFALWDGWAL